MRAETTATARVSTAPVSAVPGSAARILVIDDEPLLREFLQESLRRQGHAVPAAGGAEEALRLIPLDPPDLNLLDIRMQGRDGL